MNDIDDSVKQFLQRVDIMREDRYNRPNPNQGQSRVDTVTKQFFQNTPSMLPPERAIVLGNPTSGGQDTGPVYGSGSPMFIVS